MPVGPPPGPASAPASTSSTAASPPASGSPGAGSSSGSSGWQDRFPPVAYWVKVGAVIIGIVVLLRMLAILQGVLVILIASAVLAVGMQPALDWLVRRRLPRPAALAVIMAAGLAVVVAAGMLIVPVVIAQSRALVEALPEWIDGLAADSPLVEDLLDRLDPGVLLQQMPDGALSAVGGALATVIDLVLVLTLAPYFALAVPQAKRTAVRLLVRRDRERFMLALNRSTDLMANYIVGNLVVSVIAGVVAWLGLLAIGVPFAAALAVIVALTDLVPAVGATIGGATVVAVSLAEGPGTALVTAAFLLTYQQVENFVIVPRVMRDAIDVAPATAIVALLIGGTLAGPVGALLALPIAALAQVLMAEFVIADRVAAVRAADAEEQATRRGPRWATRRRLP